VNRLDPYTAVHKMQRSRLFGLTVAAGKTDPSDATAQAHLAAAINALADELTAHAGHEDRLIHPLLRRHAPDLAQALDTAHRDLDVRLRLLRDTAQAGATVEPNALYRALASFTAAYLDHLSIEETQVLPRLWQTCTDDELQHILVAFREGRSDTENLTSVLAQLPTLNPPEIARMVELGLSAVPVAEVIELLATVLDPGQLGALGRALTAQPASR
jgi:iron-sulfur cluster repair protein YtfE (RIC family)